MSVPMQFALGQVGPDIGRDAPGKEPVNLFGGEAARAENGAKAFLAARHGFNHGEQLPVRLGDFRRVLGQRRRDGGDAFGVQVLPHVVNGWERL